MEGSDDGPEVPEPHEKAKMISATVGGKVYANSLEDWVNREFPALFRGGRQSAPQG